jgi:hypothetical protein
MPRAAMPVGGATPTRDGSGLEMQDEPAGASFTKEAEGPVMADSVGAASRSVLQNEAGFPALAARFGLPPVQ